MGHNHYCYCQCPLWCVCQSTCIDIAFSVTCVPSFALFPFTARFIQKCCSPVRHTYRREHEQSYAFARVCVHRLYRSLRSPRDVALRLICQSVCPSAVIGGLWMPPQFLSFMSS